MALPYECFVWLVRDGSRYKVYDTLVMGQFFFIAEVVGGTSTAKTLTAVQCTDTVICFGEL